MVTLKFTPSVGAALLGRLFEDVPGDGYGLRAFLTRGQGERLTLRFSRVLDATSFDRTETSQTFPRAMAPGLRALLVETLRHGSGLRVLDRARVGREIARLDEWLDTPIVDRVAVLGLL